MARASPSVFRRTASIAFVIALSAFGLAAQAFADVTCTGTIGDEQIDDTVVVPDSASCTLRGTSIDGNVLIGRDADLTADGISLSGNVQDDNGQGGRVIVRGSTIGGSIQLEDGRGAIDLEDNVVDGDIQTNANTGGVDIVGNRIDGNLQCQANDPPPTGGDNVVAGSAEDQCSDLSGSGGPEATARTTDDSCPAGEVPEDGFEDADGSTHENAIDCVVWWDLTQGTSQSTYSPRTAVDRAQMASFIAQLITESGGSLPAPTQDHFTDDNGTTHEANINRLAEAGIVGGTDEGRYAPADPVQRDQMATFLVRAYEYRTDTTLPPGENYFADDDGNPHETQINKAAEAGFTGGTADGGYRPAEAVSRAQMASFLTRTLDLLVEAGSVTPPTSS